MHDTFAFVSVKKNAYDSCEFKFYSGSSLWIIVGVIASQYLWVTSSEEAEEKPIHIYKYIYIYKYMNFLARKNVIKHIYINVLVKDNC